MTTALELEAGACPVAAAYRIAAAEGRPVNYGFATSWAQARMDAVAGIAPGGTLADFLSRLGDPRWQRPAEPAQLTALFSRLAGDLADGALGIGVLLGYAPAVDPAEYLRVAALAAEAGVPTFTHARDLIEMVPHVPVDGAEEIVRAAGQTGAHMHYCHVNSTSQRHIDRVLGLVGRAQAAGAQISTEAYPYGSGMTAIGAAFLAPERLGERGLVPSSLTYAPTGERVASADRLRELRRDQPGGLAIIKFLDENDAADRELLMRSLTFPGAVVASDAMPLTWTDPADPLAWPLAASAITHPRTAGTFSRAVRLLTRGDGPLGLAQALSKCSLQPAPGCSRPGAGDAPQGSASGGRRCRRGGVRPGHAHRPGHLRRQHAAVGRNPARSGQRDVRGSRRLDRRRRAAWAAGPRRTAVTADGALTRPSGRSNTSYV